MNKSIDTHENISEADDRGIAKIQQVVPLLTLALK